MTAEMVEAGWSDAQADCRRVFEENSHPMWVVEAQELVDVNRAALLHYGYSRDEFLALTIDDLSVEKPAPAKVAQDRHAVSRHRRKDGSFIDVEVTSFAVTFRGRPASLKSILDVT
jgi:PAS domain S-box-containing protein